MFIGKARYGRAIFRQADQLRRVLIRRSHRSVAVLAVAERSRTVTSAPASNSACWEHAGPPVRPGDSRATLDPQTSWRVSRSSDILAIS
jgi:hypothetical protein